jgi:hypothetical protein
MKLHDELKQEILELKEQGFSNRKISKKLNVPKSTIGDFLSKKSYKTWWDEYKYINEELSRNVRILLFDIETAPCIHYNWGRWKQNVVQSQVIREGHILTWAAKFLGEDTVTYDAIWDHPSYKEDTSSDFLVCQSFYELIKEADIVVYHNGDKFDFPWLRTQWVKHGFDPTIPIRSVDTLKLAKSQFRFPSNRLGDLAFYLGLEQQKMDTGGFQLWSKCDLDQDPEAQQKMVDYNIQDIFTLEDVYLKLRAWDMRHPNVSVYYPDNKARCVVCGSDDLHLEEKRVTTNLSLFEVMTCGNCGKPNRKRVSLLGKTKRQNLVTNILGR